ncbi:MAG: dienelactone hydrolase family protein [Bryobacter sp.]|jgi:carboxymethylenebutenolidase|nr:dienelactone hydrolase family protein [Bryobacter sp. CoA8 C33]
MERKQASDFPPELLNLLDLYVHGDMDRRDFIENCQRFATGGISAAMLFESLRPNYAWARQVPPDDKRITTSTTTVESSAGNGIIRGFLAMPALHSGKIAAVIVIHENRGLNPYIEDVARRLAVENFIAFAPDGLTSVGGYPGGDERGAKLFQSVDREKMTEDFVAAAEFLKFLPNGNGNLGAVGFCFGGGISNTLAVRLGAMLNAAAPFYGAQPQAEDVSRIQCPLLLHYASNDARVNAGWPAYEEALKANQVRYQAFFYQGTNHGFHNDTTPRYDAAAAKLAWSRTLAFFRQHLLD